MMTEFYPSHNMHQNKHTSLNKFGFDQEHHSAPSNKPSKPTYSHFNHQIHKGTNDFSSYKKIDQVLKSISSHEITIISTDPHLKSQLVTSLPKQYTHIKYVTLSTASDLKKNLFDQKLQLIVIEDWHLRTADIDVCFCLWTGAKLRPKLVIITDYVNPQLEEIVKVTPSVSNMFQTTVPFVLSPISDFKCNIQFVPDISVPDLTDNNIYYQAANRVHQLASETGASVALILPNRDKVDFALNILRKIKMNGVTFVTDFMQKPQVTRSQQIYLLTSTDANKVLLEHQSDIKIVVDTMVRENKSKFIDESFNTKFTFISKDMAKHRSNLVNTYICIFSEHTYSQLDQHDTPELIYCESYYDIVRFCRRYVSKEFDPNIVFKTYISEQFVGCLKDDRITQSISKQYESLQKLGFIATTQTSVACLRLAPTHLFKFCHSIPLSLRRAAVLFNIKILKDPNTLLILSVLCTLEVCGSSFYDKSLDDKFTGYSMLDTIVNIWIELYLTINPFNKDELKEFCRIYNLDYYQLKQTVNLLKECLVACAESDFMIEYDLKTFQVIDRRNISLLFYYVFGLTHPEYEAHVYPGFSTEKLKAICPIHIGKQAGSSGQGRNAGQDNYTISTHSIDRESVHNMATFSMTQKCYILNRIQKYNKEHRCISIITVLHTIPDEIEQRKSPLSVFSSEMDDSKN